MARPEKDNAETTCKGDSAAVDSNIKQAGKNLRCHHRPCFRANRGGRIGLLSSLSFTLAFDFREDHVRDSSRRYKVITHHSVCFQDSSERCTILCRANPPIGLHQELIVVCLELSKQQFRRTDLRLVEISQVANVIHKNRVGTTKEDID